jgi:hypothetical protein
MMDNKERLQRKAALQQAHADEPVEQLAKRRREDQIAYDEMTNQWVTASRMMFPTICMIRLRKTELWYDLKVRMAPRQAGRDNAVKENLDEPRVAHGCVLDCDFRV